ncbi:MAG: MGDG synthase family glycosyltransferase [Anaerolineaceae bacterium]
MNKILILSADAGFGHRSAAIAIQEALRIEYSDTVYVEIINPLENKLAPAILRDSQTDYDKWVREVPELYRFGYQASDGVVTSIIMERVLTVLLFDVMKNVIKEFDPQVIVTTYPLYQAPLIAVLNAMQIKIPVITVFTDLSTLHRIWFNSDVDICVVPNDTVKEMAISYGVESEKIFVCGIPVRPIIAKYDQSKQQYRKELGWTENKITILAVGSKRVEHFGGILNTLNHSGFDLQLVIVTGKDEELFKEMNENEWHQTSKIYEFVEDMPKFMKASDVIISKAGGLIVTESLACGLPLILIDVIPGQETGNAEFVLEHHAGIWIQNREDFLEAFCHLLLNDYFELNQMQINAKSIGDPYAAIKIAEKIIFSIQNPPNSINKPKEGILKILDFLEKNPIHLEF